MDLNGRQMFGEPLEVGLRVGEPRKPAELIVDEGLKHSVPEDLQMSVFRIHGCQSNPLIEKELAEFWVGSNGRKYAFGRGFYHEQNADRFMDFDCLDGQAGSQIALIAVHDADESADIVWKFCAASVPLVVDGGKVVFETDSPADGNDSAENACQALIGRVKRGVVSDEECSAIEEESPCGLSSPDDRHGIGAVPVFGPGFADVLGALLHVP